MVFLYALRVSVFHCRRQVLLRYTTHRHRNAHILSHDCLKATALAFISFFCVFGLNVAVVMQTILSLANLYFNFNILDLTSKLARCIYMGYVYFELGWAKFRSDSKTSGWVQRRVFETNRWHHRHISVCFVSEMLWTNQL